MSDNEKQNKTTKKEPVDEPVKPVEKPKNNNNNSKESLVELVETYTKNRKYSTDIIVATFVNNNLYDTYEEDYKQASQGLPVEKRLTPREFENLIEKELNRKL